MEFRIVDTEELLKNFKPYHQSMDKITKEKDKFTTRVESIRDEIEGIVKDSQIILDEKTMQTKQLRFKELQAEALELENEFREMISKLQNEELDKNFRAVSSVIEEWSGKNKIEHVFNKLQLAYTNGTSDCTNEVIDLFKEKELFEEYIQPDTSVPTER